MRGVGQGLAVFVFEGFSAAFDERVDVPLAWVECWYAELAGFGCSPGLGWGVPVDEDVFEDGVLLGLGEPVAVAFFAHW